MQAEWLILAIWALPLVLFAVLSHRHDERWSKAQWNLNFGGVAALTGVWAVSIERLIGPRLPAVGQRIMGLPMMENGHVDDFALGLILYVAAFGIVLAVHTLLALWLGSDRLPSRVRTTVSGILHVLTVALLVRIVYVLGHPGAAFMVAATMGLFALVMCAEDPAMSAAEFRLSAEQKAGENAYLRQKDLVAEIPLASALVGERSQQD
jgi:hypothetical protein